MASFTNPAVFKAVQENIGETVEVSITKNAKGYDEWAAVSPSTNTGGSGTASQTLASSGPATTTRVAGSNYETPVERAKRQVLIVRQSSLNVAREVLKDQGVPYNLADLKEAAQELVDWVFDEGEEENV